MDQQFEEMNNKLNSVTDPTGFLRMVRRNNLFNRCVLAWSRLGLLSRWWDTGFRRLLLLQPSGLPAMNWQE